MIGLLLTHWRTALIVAAVAALIGTAVAYVHQREARAVAELLLEQSRERLEASVAAMDSAEANRARSDSLASLAAQEVQQVRAVQAEEARLARVAVSRAADMVRTARAALDSVDVPPEAVAVIEAQDAQIEALGHQLYAVEAQLVASDTLTSIWSNRYSVLQASFQAQGTALEAAQAALDAAVSLGSAKEPSRLRQAAWTLVAVGVGYLAHR